MVIGHKLVNVARDEAIKTVLPPGETDYSRNWAGMRRRDRDTTRPEGSSKLTEGGWINDGVAVFSFQDCQIP